MKTLVTLTLCVILCSCNSTKSNYPYRLQPSKTEEILRAAVSISKAYTGAKLKAQKTERQRKLEELQLLLELLKLKIDVQRLQQLERLTEELSSQLLIDEAIDNIRKSSKPQELPVIILPITSKSPVEEEPCKVGYQPEYRGDSEDSAGIAVGIRF